MSEQGERRIRTLLDNVYVQAGSVLTVGVALLGMVWQISAWRSETEHAIRANTHALQALTEQMAGYPDVVNSVRDLEKKIVGRGPDGWHRTDMRLWCLETEKLNQEWLCAETGFKP